MTIRDLINILIGLPPNMEVVFSDFDDEWLSICPVSIEILPPESDEDDDGFLILRECDCENETSQSVENKDIIDSIDQNLN